MRSFYEGKDSVNLRAAFFQFLWYFSKGMYLSGFIFLIVEIFFFSTIWLFGQEYDCVAPLLVVMGGIYYFAAFIISDNLGYKIYFKHIKKFLDKNGFQKIDNYENETMARELLKKAGRKNYLAATVAVIALFVWFRFFNVSYILIPIDNGINTIGVTCSTVYDLHIPSEFCGYEVTTFGKYDCCNDTLNTKNVYIEEGIENIDVYNVTTEALYIPASVSCIDSWFGDEKLRSVYIEDGENLLIYRSAFAYCENLQEIRIRENVTIEERAFSHTQIKFSSLITEESRAKLQEDGMMGYLSEALSEEMLTDGTIDELEEKFAKNTQKLFDGEIDSLNKFAEIMLDQDSNQDELYEAIDIFEEEVYRYGVDENCGNLTEWATGSPVYWLEY